MLDIDQTDHADLRSRQSPWKRQPLDLRDGDLTGNTRCEVLIVGGGITGSLMAEHLSAQGRQVLLLDRETPGLGSTAASTAMLQWEIDAPLSELTQMYGFEKAADIYKRSFRAVQGLRGLANTLQIPCDFRERSTLYIAGGDSGIAELKMEFDLRQKADLPGAFLSHIDLLDAFDIDREAAILSPGSADADPLCLAQGLLRCAKQRGVQVMAGNAVGYDHQPRKVVVELENGTEIEARHVVLATGYVMPDFIVTDLHSSATSWAIETVPQPPGTLWPDEVLIWEASESYIYARTTRDGRIIIGGDDEAMTDPDARNAAIAAKSARLQRELAKLWPAADTTVARAWAGVFGETSDGLPLIGPIPGMPRIFAAYGYGGNGITFSYMASRIIGRLIGGNNQSWFAHFALDRPNP
jgi:glycine/D-amino acid oxidase-like deaminating enzyme